jgi:hypothetical protein
MFKRVVVLLSTLLLAFGAGIGVGFVPNNPSGQALLLATGVLAVWGLVRVLSRDGDIWKFDAPYRSAPYSDGRTPTSSSRSNRSAGSL